VRDTEEVKKRKVHRKGTGKAVEGTRQYVESAGRKGRSLAVRQLCHVGRKRLAKGRIIKKEIAT